MSQSTEELLAVRRASHGDFTLHAACTQAVMDVWMAQPNWAKLTPVQKEFLHMTAHKCGRILTGDPDHQDHYDDIAGYAKLVSDRLLPPFIVHKSVDGLSDLEADIRVTVVRDFDRPGTPEDGGQHVRQDEEQSDYSPALLQDGLLNPPADSQFIAVKTATTMYYNVDRRHYADAVTEHLPRLSKVINDYEWKHLNLCYMGMYVQLESGAYELERGYWEHWGRQA